VSSLDLTMFRSEEVVTELETGHAESDLWMAVSIVLAVLRCCVEVMIYLVMEEGRHWFPKLDL
jgi:hypothetical protein